MKFEAARIQFLGDVFAAFAVVVASLSNYDDDYDNVKNQ